MRRLGWLGLAALIGVGCSSSSDGGSVTGKTAYLSCAVDAAACPGAALCSTEAGTTACVPLPSACDGKLTCACLAATVCDGDACTDGAAGISCKAASGETCVPGESFPSPDGCNSCSCPPSGKKTEAACTAMACADTCTPGESFPSADGCNTCTCPDSGQKSEAACTEKACVDPDACTPGDTYPAADGCNTCTCPANGKKSEAACTDMACVDPDACTPGDTYPAADGCNTCTCPASGKKAESLCTLTPCVDPDACTPGESFPSDDGCNTCTCPDSGKKSEAACTEKACIDTCIPGESFPSDDGCNTCTCPDSGKKSEAACTKKACTGDDVQCAAASPIVFPEPPDACQADADCAVVLHQINCCGTLVAWGIAKSGVEAFQKAEATCQSQYPGCGCAQFQTKADDGSTGWSAGDFVAVCAGGECKSQGANVCHASAKCGNNGAYCLSPGASQGCGMCMDPEQGFVTTCQDDAECQAKEPSTICLESTIADCLCSPAQLCKPGCTSNESCAEGEVCQEDKHCAPTPCSAEADCPANFACASGACARKTCTANTECSGYCVNGECYAAPGMCTFPVP